jgi:hypothetical protein
LGHRGEPDTLAELADPKLGQREIFACVERMIATGQPAGYDFKVPHAINRRLATAPAWAALAMLCHLGACAERHHLDSDSPYAEHSAIFADTLRFHRPTSPGPACVEATQWRRAQSRMKGPARHRAVRGFAEILRCLDGVVLVQANADGEHFTRVCGRALGADRHELLLHEIRSAYRWQFITSGMSSPRFEKLLDSMIEPAERRAIRFALPPLAA